jgi:two-component system sensor histidine kinase BaeS
MASDLAPAVVAGDRGRLDQVAANLLSNALRYTDAGGQVTVTVRRDGGLAVLEVADTGIGIAAQDVPRVFTRFWRGERSRSRATGGAGIGLSIVKELVTAHGGRVEVRSVVAEGSTFTVTIPAADRPPSR